MPDVKQSRTRGTVRVHTAPDVKTSKLTGQKDLSSWVDRVNASDIMGVSINTLVNWEQEGKLHPQKHLRRLRDGRERELYVYDPNELAMLPKRTRIEIRTRGEVTALAFELFREGAALDTVAIELREEPDTVISLHERWLDMSRARHVISSVAWAALEEVVGKFDDVASLLTRVRDLASTDRELAAMLVKLCDAVERSKDEFGANDALREAIRDARALAGKTIVSDAMPAERAAGE